MIDISLTNCTNDILYHCWDCEENCFVKNVLLFPEFFFWSILHTWHHTTVEYLVSNGIPVEDAEYAQNLRIISLVSARIKMRGQLKLLIDD